MYEHDINLLLCYLLNMTIYKALLSYHLVRRPCSDFHQVTAPI